MESNEQLAIFLDVENFIGFSNDLKLPMDLSEILERLKEEGRIIIRRSFGDLDRSLHGIDQTKQRLNIRKMLRDNLFIHEDIPYKNQFKNSADMRLAVEMLYTAFTIPTITKFAVISGDSDYVPVFQKLQEQNKTIIGISGSENSTAVIYRNACDRVIYFDDLSRQAVPAESAIGQTAFTHTSEAPQTDDGAIAKSSNETDNESKVQSKAVQLVLEQTHRDEYAALLVRALKVLESEGRGATFQNLVVQMRQLKSDFNYERAGFASFHDLAKFAAEQQLVSLEKQGDRIFVVLPTSESLPKQATSTAHYRKALQEKLKCQIPSLHVRKAICANTFKLLPFYEDGVLLNDLSRDVAEDLSLEHVNVPQNEVFKYLLSLRFSLCFYFEDAGAGSFNPLITGFRAQSEEWDDRFVVSQSRLLEQEGLPLFADKLSSLFYETEEKTVHLRRLLERNGLKVES